MGRRFLGSDQGGPFPTYGTVAQVTKTDDARLCAELPAKSLSAGRRGMVGARRVCLVIARRCLTMLDTLRRLIIRITVGISLKEEIMNVERILEFSEPSLLIIEERPRKDIVVGVPHHAPAGKSTLPCPEHRDSDENAGFLGHYLAEKLACCSIIACNYTVDVNKCDRSDYTMQIARWNPRVLVEIHGHAGKKTKGVEISSGSSNRAGSKALEEKLKAVLSTSTSEVLKTISICGEYGELKFKARRTVTICDGRWLAYHMELPPQLRKASGNASGKPPQTGYQFCDALAKVLEEIHGS